MPKAKIYKEDYSGYGWYKLLYDLGLIETEYEPHMEAIVDVLPDEEMEIFRKESIMVEPKKLSKLVDEDERGLEMRYFVLKPEGTDPHHKACRHAIRHYTDVIEKHNPKLANDLRRWVRKIEDRIEEDPTYEIGQKLQRIGTIPEMQGGDFMICKLKFDPSVTNDAVGVINLLNGKQYGATIFVDNPYEISESELNQMLDGKIRNFHSLD